MSNRLLQTKRESVVQVENKQTEIDLNPFPTKRLSQVFKRLLNALSAKTRLKEMNSDWLKQSKELRERWQRLRIREAHNFWKQRGKRKESLNKSRKQTSKVDSQTGKRAWMKVKVFVVPWYLVVYHSPTLRCLLVPSKLHKISIFVYKWGSCM